MEGRERNRIERGVEGRKEGRAERMRERRRVRAEKERGEEYRATARGGALYQGGQPCRKGRGEGEREESDGKGIQKEEERTRREHVMRTRRGLMISVPCWTTSNQTIHLPSLIISRAGHETIPAGSRQKIPEPQMENTKCERENCKCNESAIRPYACHL